MARSRDWRPRLGARLSLVAKLHLSAITMGTVDAPANAYHYRTWAEEAWDCSRETFEFRCALVERAIPCHAAISIQSALPAAPATRASTLNNSPCPFPNTFHSCEWHLMSCEALVTCCGLQWSRQRTYHQVGSGCTRRPCRLRDTVSKQPSPNASDLTYRCEWCRRPCRGFRC